MNKINKMPNFGESTVSSNDFVGVEYDGSFNDEESASFVENSGKLPYLKKFDMAPNLTSIVSTSIDSQPNPLAESSLASSHEIQGLSKAKSMPLNIKLLSLNPSQDDKMHNKSKNISPSKEEILNNFLGKKPSSPTPAMDESHHSTLSTSRSFYVGKRYQFPGHSLPKYSGLRPSSRPGSDAPMPSQPSNSPRKPSRPPSPSPLITTRPSSPKNVFIPITNKLDPLHAEAVESEYPQNSNGSSTGEPSNSNPIEVGASHPPIVTHSLTNNSTQSDSTKKSSTPKKRTEKTKRIAYIISPEASNSSLYNVNASVSLDISSAARNEDIASGSSSNSSSALINRSLLPLPNPHPHPYRPTTSENATTTNSDVNNVNGGKGMMVMSDNISIGTEAEISTLENEHLSGQQLLPYQVHRRIMGWKLTHPRRRRDLVGMLDLVHKDPRPIDLLMGESRIVNETLERRSKEYFAGGSASGSDIIGKKRRVNYKKIPPLKKLEEQIDYLQKYQSQSNSYVSAAPGSPLYYIEEALEPSEEDESNLHRAGLDDDERLLVMLSSNEPSDQHHHSKDNNHHNNQLMGHNSSSGRNSNTNTMSAAAIRRQSRAWEKSVNRVMRIRNAYTSVQTIKRVMDERKKRQKKVEELTVSSQGGLAATGSRYGHSAFMESIERFEQMTPSAYAEYCDELEEDDDDFLDGFRAGYRNNKVVTEEEKGPRSYHSSNNDVLLNQESDELRFARANLRSGGLPATPGVAFSSVRPRSRTPIKSREGSPAGRQVRHMKLYSFLNIL